jgi:hypothetical protein
MWRRMEGAALQVASACQAGCRVMGPGVVPRGQPGWDPGCPRIPSRVAVRPGVHPWHHLSIPGLTEVAGTLLHACLMGQVVSVGAAPPPMVRRHDVTRGGTPLDQITVSSARTPPM